MLFEQRLLFRFFSLNQTRTLFLSMYSPLVSSTKAMGIQAFILWSISHILYAIGDTRVLQKLPSLVSVLSIFSRISFLMLSGVISSNKTVIPHFYTSVYCLCRKTYCKPFVFKNRFYVLYCRNIRIY